MSRGQEQEKNMQENILEHFFMPSVFVHREKESRKQTETIVHIRLQQRAGRKYLTTIQGLALDLNLKKILRALKRTFSTNGAILKDDELGNVLQLNGDQREHVFEFLTKCHICESFQIKIHGF